jgi:F-type H+-transporting ATPase subunit delta
MNSGLIAQRYAKALMKYVKETHNEVLVYSQVLSLIKSLYVIPQFRDAVQRNPALSCEDRLGLMRTALGEDPCEDLVRFVHLVDSHSRMAFISRIFIAFIDKYHESRNIKVGTLVSAVPQDELCARLEAMISEQTGGIVDLTAKVDDSLIGGFVLQVGDLRMDASVSGQFKRIRNALIDNDNRII